jgi:hypothetical protein
MAAETYVDREPVLAMAKTFDSVGDGLAVAAKAIEVAIQAARAAQAFPIIGTAIGKALELYLQQLLPAVQKLEKLSHEVSKDLENYVKIVLDGDTQLSSRFVSGG